MDQGGEDFGGGEGSDQDEELLFAKKNTVRDKLTHLYSIFTGDIDTLTNSLMYVNDDSTMKVVNAVIMHFRNAKEYIYKALSNHPEKLEYDELYRQYITMRKVYDAGIGMLNEHFKTKGGKT